MTLDNANKQICLPLTKKISWLENYFWSYSLYFSSEVLFMNQKWFKIVQSIILRAYNFQFMLYLRTIFDQTHKYGCHFDSVENKFRTLVDVISVKIEPISAKVSSKWFFEALAMTLRAYFLNFILGSIFN